MLNIIFYIFTSYLHLITQALVIRLLKYSLKSVLNLEFEITACHSFNVLPLINDTPIKLSQVHYSSLKVYHFLNTLSKSLVSIFQPLFKGVNCRIRKILIAINYSHQKIVFIMSYCLSCDAFNLSITENCSCNLPLKPLKFTLRNFATQPWL